MSLPTTWNGVDRAARRPLGWIAAAGLAALIAATPASAQWFAGDEPIPARAVVMRLLDRGFSGVSPPRFDGSAYTVEATDRWGTRVRLVIDAYDGDVLARRRLEADLRPPLDAGPRRFGRPDRVDEDEDFEPRRRYGTVERPPWSPEEPRFGRPERPPLPEEAPRERGEPLRDRNAIRVEPPARRPPAARPDSDVPAAPAPSVEAPKAAAPANPAPPASAALPAQERKPAPVPAPATPPAPAAAVTSPKPPAARAEPAPARSVRIIEGVTPVLPKADEAKPAE